MMRLVLASFLLIASIVPAQAHKVIASAYASGPLIEGEIGFSNGDFAKDVPVEVFTPDGTKLGETRTDQEGFFTFEPTVAAPHVFRANLGAGHVAEFSLSVEELPLGLTGVAPKISNKPSATLPVDQYAAIAEVVRQEIKPLRKELAAYKEKNDLQTILGGLGYIFGLAGLWFYFMARKSLKDNK